MAENSIGHWNRVYTFEAYDTWRLYPRSFALMAANAAIAKDVKSPACYADIGCGPGVLAQHVISKTGCMVYGYDHSMVALEEAQRRNPRNFVAVKNAIPPIKAPDNMFNAVIASEFLEHFRYPWRILAEFERITAHNGLIIVAVPDGVLPPKECSEHEQCFTEKTLRQLLLRIDPMPQIVPLVDEWMHQGQRYRLPVLIGIARVRK